MAWLHRAVYRVRQFGSALATRGQSLTEAERTEVRVWLPAAAWRLFDAMPHNDQHHSLNVLRSLRAADHAEPALMQAALLHDVAKSTEGVTLLHRVAVVLIKIVWPDWIARMAQTPAPARGSLRYPFWAHASHPQLGAEMAAAAGCNPLAVTLIRWHQEMGGGAVDPLWGSAGAGGQRSRRDVDLLLTALRTADDDN